MDMDEIKTPITIQDAHKLIGYSIDHIRRLAREGKIKSFKFGTTYAIDKDDLIRYKKEQDAERGWITPE
jgi:excisionase family DNA binding protein